MAARLAANCHRAGVRSLRNTVATITTRDALVRLCERHSGRLSQSVMYVLTT